MALAMEPQRKRMAVGSGGFQACPNLWHVVLPEGPGQLSKAFGVVSKAKAHPLASCSQLGLHAGFGDVEAKHRQRDGGANLRQALLLEPRHGLPPPPPQIASRFAAQINSEGKEKIQATAL